MSRTRQIIVLIVVAFLIYAVITSPNQSAGVVGNAWDAIKHGVHQIGIFFSSLIHH